MIHVPVYGWMAAGQIQAQLMERILQGSPVSRPATPDDGFSAGELGAPDFTVTSLSLSEHSPVLRGTAVEVQFDLRNAGDFAGRGLAMVSLEGSASWEFVFATPTLVQLPGESRHYSTTLDTSDLPAGPYSLLVEAVCFTDGRPENDTARHGLIVVDHLAPEADFTVSPTTGVRPLSVQFTDQSSGEITAWSWGFGDGGESTAASPSHTYVSNGNYTVTLDVLGPGGANRMTRAHCVAVGEPAPVTAAFTADQRIGDAPLEVHFTDQSTGPVSHWSWSFGDGGTSSDRYPVHTYASPGGYPVTLTVASDAGATDSETKGNYVNVCTPAPVLTADFTTSTPRTGAVPLEVYFVNQTIGTYHDAVFDFGDGCHRHGVVNHTYYDEGVYTVSLTVANTLTLESDTETKPAYITVSGHYLHASASAYPWPPGGEAPAAVNLLNNSVGTITSCLWDFGDGNASSDWAPTHTYEQAGYYTVSLTVTGPYGSDQELDVDWVHVVAPPPVASFAVNPPEGEAPLRVAFTDTSSGDITSRAWDFGDGTIGSEASLTHTFVEGGDFTVTLNVTGAGGSGSASETVHVSWPVPMAEFTWTPDPGEGFLTVHFAYAGRGPATGWTWDFGDGGVSYEEHPIHVYAAAAQYPVTMTVVGPGGSDQVQHAVAVAPALSVDAGPDQAVAGGQSAVLPASASGGAEPYVCAWSPTAGLDDPTLLQPTASPSVTTVYSLTVTDALGQTAQDAVTVAVASFVDAPPSQWAFSEIESCISAGVVGGYDDGTYRPGLLVSRDQMAVFISRALTGGDAFVPIGPVAATFSDVPTDHWAFRYVEYAASSGVVGGYDDGTYRPDETVTRDQMAVFIARAVTGGEEYVPTAPATASFPDVPTDHWAFKHVEYIRGEGVTGGYPDGTYRPEEVVTRDQMAVYVQRAFGLPI